MSYFFVLLLAFLKLTSALELIDVCETEKQLGFPCKVDQDIQFCIFNIFECIVLKPSDFKNETICSDTELFLNWTCYDGSIQDLIYSTDPNNLNEPLDHLIFSLDYKSSYPRPYSLLNGESANVDENGIEHYQWNNTNHGNYSLKIYQPGFKDYEEIWVSIKENEEESNLVIILVTVIPCSIGFLVTAISLWICYRKKLCCFASRRRIETPAAPVLTAQGRTNNIYHVDRRSMQVSQSNIEFIDDSNFAEVDLNDNHANEAPMTSYIQRVAARYGFSRNAQQDDFDEESSQTIGRCRCLENYTPTRNDENSGLLTVERGEELILIQKDFGSGWTYLQKVDGSVGFVPTSILYFFD